MIVIHNLQEFKKYIRKYGDKKVNFIKENCYIKAYNSNNEIIYSSDPESCDWHRLDGPAHIKFYDDGSIATYDWYINDYYLTHKIEKWAKENDIDLDNLSEVDKALIKLTWADYNGK